MNNKKGGTFGGDMGTKWDSINKPVSMIPDMVSERNNASTCILDIPPAARSKTVSFQKGPPANNDKIGDLSSGKVMCSMPINCNQRSC